ncbi:MAG: hypothetical protein MUC64_09120 [Rubritepida sp.]|nr:hypothetical protein [Rubritepida sp.]
MTLDLSAKTTAELRTLKANAEGVIARGDAKRLAQAEALREAATAELARRGSAALAGARARAGVAATATREAVDRLTSLAREAQASFDLSPPPKTVQPHRLTAADGTPKVGGRQRSRGVAADRYLSHKNGERIVRIGWVREHEEPADTGGRWYVGLWRADEETRSDDFEHCRAEFWAALSAVAPKR